MTNPNNDRIGSHWTTCWRDGGRRHYACAVAEAERQIARAEAAEAQLAAVRQRAEAAERERYNHKLRALELDMLVDGLEKRVSTLTEKLLSEMERAEALETQLASIPAYAAYYADAQLAHDLAEGPAPLSFAEWLGERQRQEAHP